MKPQLPLRREGNDLYEAGGHRIACFLTEADATEALAIHGIMQKWSAGGEGQVPFEALILFYLLSGEFTRSDAESWVEPDLPKFSLAVAAVKRAEAAAKDDPFGQFCLYLTEEEAAQEAIEVEIEWQKAMEGQSCPA